MELKRFINMVRKRIVFIVCIPILISAITAVVSIFIINPVYEASSTLYIVNQKSVSEELMTYDEILANEHLVKDYRELMKSKLITKAVIEELNIKDITPDVLSRNITVESKNNTRVLEITVKDNNPVRAKDLTNIICKIFMNKSEDLMKINNISVVDVAEVQNNPVDPKPLLYITLSFLISILSTLGIFYLLDLISETIKTSEDIETYLGLNVLGTIPLFNIK